MPILNGKLEYVHRLSDAAAAVGFKIVLDLESF